MENVIDLKRRIGRRLQTLRKQHHLSQEVVAKVLGVRSITYCGYEDGKQLIHTRLVIKLAAILRGQLGLSADAVEPQVNKYKAPLKSAPPDQGEAFEAEKFKKVVI